MLYFTGENRLLYFTVHKRQSESI